MEFRFAPEKRYSECSVGNEVSSNQVAYAQATVRMVNTYCQTSNHWKKELEQEVTKKIKSQILRPIVINKMPKMKPVIRNYVNVPNQPDITVRNVVHTPKGPDVKVENHVPEVKIRNINQMPELNNKTYIHNEPKLNVWNTKPTPSIVVRPTIEKEVKQ